MVLEDGWHGAERDGATTFRWASSSAALLIPLDHPAALVLQVRLHAFGYREAPPQTLTVTVNGRALPARTIGPDWEIVEMETAVDLWRAGVNRVRFAFGGTARPADVGLGGDRRPLSAAVDYVRVVKR